jgi:hypothetical protein
MKILNTTQHSATLKLILGVVMATCVFTAAANAQPIFVGTFTLPYEVHWNHAVLPAGEYAIRMDSKGAVALVRSISSNKLDYTAPPIIGNGEKGATFLTVTIHGNERKVRSLNLSADGQSLIFEPLTKAERETFAKAGQIDSVPVITAQK